MLAAIRGVMSSAFLAALGPSGGEAQQPAAVTAARISLHWSELLDQLGTARRAAPLHLLSPALPPLLLSPAQRLRSNALALCRRYAALCLGGGSPTTVVIRKLLRCGRCPAALAVYRVRFNAPRSKGL